jgi:hypothetical protein
MRAGEGVVVALVVVVVGHRGVRLGERLVRERMQLLEVLPCACLPH